MMPKKTAENILEKIGRKKDFLLTLEQAKKWVGGDAKVFSKAIFLLRSRGVLLPLKKWLFVAQPTVVEEGLVVEKFYRKLLVAQCQNFVGKKWYVGGVKALEIQLGIVDAPEEVWVVNEAKSASEVVIFGKKVLWKKYSAGKKSYFSLVKNFLETRRVGGISLLVAGPELAMVEALFGLRPVDRAWVQQLVVKLWKKKKREIRREIRASLLEAGKHHASLARLEKILRGSDPKSAEQLAALLGRLSYGLEV